MKKFIAGLMATCLMMINILPAIAAVSIADVSINYWAKKEIQDVVDNNIMSVDASKRFNPEAKMTRIEFVNSLLKLLSNNNKEVKTTNIFSDVNTSTPGYLNILRSQDLGLVYGYPDKTFQPERIMTRAETQSVISHITQDKVSDLSILNQFKDADSIPNWAKQVYAKTIHYGIYVNYPDASELRPNDELTRAEAAVLLSRLKDKLGLVKEQYVGKEVEKLISVEHLDISKKAESNEVKITNMRKIILEGNVLAVAFEAKFKSEEHKAGDAVYFVNDEDICTTEGTLVIPANSKFIAQVLEIKDPKWFNKNARVYVQICKIVLPNGKEIAMNAKPFYKNYELKEGPWMTAGKLALYTVTGGAVGTGAGVGLAFIPDPTKIGTGIAIGAPVGAAVGLITGLVTPGLKYHAKCGEEIFVILLEDASIPNK